MPLTRPLNDLRADLLQLLTEDIAAALKQLQSLLPENTDKYAAVIALLGRLNDANKARLRNTLSNEDLQRQYDRIRADLFDLLQGLTEADFDSSNTGSADKAHAGARSGSVLYKVPHTMPLQEETRCIVRIAINEDAIVEDITIDDNTTLKDLYRVTDTMQAELLDPSGGKVFSIRTTSEPIQIIDEQGFTEWRFYVTPLKEGVFPLEVKVSVIEQVAGVPRRKEIVLEETVRIVTENVKADEEATPFKPAGYALSFQQEMRPAPGELTSFEMEESQVVGPKDVPYAPENTVPSDGVLPTKGRSPLRMLAVVLAFILVGSGATWALTPPETRDWVMAHYVQDNPEAYASFIDKYPLSTRRELAMYRRAELSSSVADYRAYLHAYRAGKYQTIISTKLENRERSDFETVRQIRDAGTIRKFVELYPESSKLDELKQLIEQRPELKQELMPVIEEKINLRNIKRDTSLNIKSGLTKPGIIDAKRDSASLRDKRLLSPGNKLERKIERKKNPQ